jgi:hypothetical protein
MALYRNSIRRLNLGFQYAATLDEIANWRAKVASFLLYQMLYKRVCHSLLQSIVCVDRLDHDVTI